MANTLTRYVDTDIGTTPSTVMTVAASTTTTVIGLMLGNTHTSQVEVDVTVAGAKLLTATPIPAGSSLEIMGGNKIVLNATDTVVVESNVAASVDVIVSVLEQT